MITNVRVKNFKSIADASVDLGPLTVLVGRNGAGKSAFLDVLQFVRDALSIGLEDAILARNGIAAIRRWAPTRPRNIEITITIQRASLKGEYSFTIVSGKSGTYRVKREYCRVRKAQGKEEIEFETLNGKWIKLPERYMRRRRTSSVEETGLVFPSLSVVSHDLYLLRRFLRGSFYNIFPNVLREPQKPSNERLLSDHGGNLASIIRRMDSKVPNFNRLRKTLGLVVDGVRDLRVREVGSFLVTELQHNDVSEASTDAASPWFDLGQESDGTLRILGILVALFQRPLAPGLMALEEPESSIHPGALAVLSDVIREHSRRSQVIVTTQSPDLISRFAAKELRIVEKLRGLTEIGPIDDIQRSVIEEQLFSAGDLLRIEGLRSKTI